jgi:hypothetical protein
MRIIHYATMAIGFGFFPALGLSSYLISQNIEQIAINVVSKERIMKVSTSNGTTSTNIKNFIYTDSETFVVEDSFWNWHFRAGTVYAKIREGATCNVTVVGYRWGFLSMYQNIIEADCE